MKQSLRKLSLYVAIAIVTILGSLFVCLGSNMLFHDILNIGAGAAHLTFPVTIPAATMAVIYPLLVLFLVRWYKYPGALRSLVRVYASIILVLSLAGIVGIVTSCIFVYHTFLWSVHPFPGYLILFLVLHAFNIVACVLALVFSPLLPKREKAKLSFGRLIVLILWFHFIMLMFNRFGTFAAAPVYIYWRTFGKTFPFYFFLLTPLFLGFLELLHKTNFLGKVSCFLVIGLTIGCGMFMVTNFALTIAFSVTDSAVISALSHAMPLERMASFPMEIFIHFFVYVAVSIVLIVQSIVRLVKKSN